MDSTDQPVDADRVIPAKRQTRKAKGDMRFSIPKSIFRAITREILANRHTKIRLFDRKSMLALQTEAEQFVSDLFQLSHELSSLSGHYTVDLTNLKSAVAIYNRYHPTHS